jgi:hypothetical protein
MDLPSFRAHRALLATIDVRAAGCRPLSTACACPPSDSLPATLPGCYLQDGRVIVRSPPSHDGCRDRAFVRDLTWTPQFPRDERALGGEWVSSARRVDRVWVQVELKPCLD